MFGDDQSLSNDPKTIDYLYKFTYYKSPYSKWNK